MFRVLLVCTGNICRSPIAHGVLADRSRRVVNGEIEARSAGTWAGGGSPATDEAVSAAAELGIDIGAHRSSRFSSHLAEWADLILTMTAEQRDEVVEEAPEARSKTFTIKSFAARHAGRAEPADGDVADPLGMPESAYRAVAREIEGLIDDLVPGLVGDAVVAIKES